MCVSFLRIDFFFVLSNRKMSNDDCNLILKITVSSIIKLKKNQHSSCVKKYFKIHAQDITKLLKNVK